jgi:beta-glucosidase
MRYKLPQLLPSLALLTLGHLAEAQTTPIFRDTKQPLSARVNDLIKQLSLEEKAQQMLDQSPAIPRLGIPAYSWWNEALHGVGRSAPATVFPQAIGLGATFDDDLALREATAISDEARAVYNRPSPRITT